MTEAAQKLSKQFDASSAQPATAKAYAATSATSKMSPLTIQRRAPRPQDVQIDILYCGVCHSDLHTVRDEWKAVMPTVYPCVPGHEIVGRVVKTGQRGEEIQRRRHRRGWLHGRFRSHVRELRGGRRAVLRNRRDVHLQHAGQNTRRSYLRRIFGKHCR